MRTPVAQSRPYHGIWEEHNKIAKHDIRRSFVRDREMAPFAGAGEDTVN